MAQRWCQLRRWLIRESVQNHYQSKQKVLEPGYVTLLAETSENPEQACARLLRYNISELEQVEVHIISRSDALKMKFDIYWIVKLQEREAVRAVAQLEVGGGFVGRDSLV